MNRTLPEVQIMHAAPQNTKISLTLADSPVAAGFPSPADDFAQDKLDLNEHLIKHPAATFFVRVAGMSMRGAGIQPNDLLVVDRAVEPYHGAIVVAVIDGEFTLKRLKKERGRVVLQPENNSYKPIVVDDTSDFQVWGVVTHVIHSTQASPR